MIIYNSFNVSVLAWSNHSRSPVVVEPGHQAPQGTTLMTIHALKKQKKHVAVWSRHDHFILPTDSDSDVLGGRGNHGRTHAGNIYFTDLVHGFTQEYRTATPARRTRILREIQTHMNQTNRRFLKLQLYDRHRRIYRWVVDPSPLAKIGNKMRDTIDALDAQALPAPLVAAFLPFEHHPLLDNENRVVDAAHYPQSMVVPQVAALPVENHPLHDLNNNGGNPVNAPDPPPIGFGNVPHPVMHPMDELLNDVVADDDLVEALVADQDNLEDVFVGNPVNAVAQDPPPMGLGDVPHPVMHPMDELLNDVIADDDLVEALVADQDNLEDLFNDELLQDEHFVENLAFLRDMMILEEDDV